MFCHGVFKRCLFSDPEHVILPHNPEPRFDLVRFYLGLSDLAAAAGVCKAWHVLVVHDPEAEHLWLAMLVQDDCTGLRLRADVTGRRPVHVVARRHCLRARDEVQFLRNLCHFPAHKRFPQPRRAPPSRPKKEDRIGYMPKWVDSMDWAAMDAAACGDGGIDNGWTSVMRYASCNIHQMQPSARRLQTGLQMTHRHSHHSQLGARCVLLRAANRRQRGLFVPSCANVPDLCLDSDQVGSACLNQ